MVSNLHSKQLSAGLCHVQGSLSLSGPLPHYPQCHNGLAPSRSEHVCLCRSVPRWGSWYDKWEGFPYLRPKSPASKTLAPPWLTYTYLRHQEYPACNGLQRFHKLKCNSTLLNQLISIHMVMWFLSIHPATWVLFLLQSAWLLCLLFYFVSEHTWFYMTIIEKCWL